MARKTILLELSEADARQLEKSLRNGQHRNRQTADVWRRHGLTAAAGDVAGHADHYERLAVRVRELIKQVWG